MGILVTPSPFEFYSIFIGIKHARVVVLERAQVLGVEMGFVIGFLVVRFQAARSALVVSSLCEGGSEREIVSASHFHSPQVKCQDFSILK